MTTFSSHGDHPMNKSAKILLGVTLAIAFSLCIVQSSHAGGNSRWGFAKPINQKIGLLYSSNRNVGPKRGIISSPRIYGRTTTSCTPRRSTVVRPMSTNSYRTTRISKSNSNTPLWVPIPRPYPLRALQPYGPFGF